MKRYNKLFFPAIFLLLTVGSCKKWLDIKPKTQVSQQDQFSTEQGFKDGLIGIYLQLGTSPQYGQHMTMGFLDALAQNYITSNTAHIFYNAARFTYKETKTREYIDAIWTSLYGNIANANNLLAQLEGKESLFSANNYQLVKGEALGIRAFLHFDLLRLFGPAPVIDAQGKSIPYVTGFNVRVYPILPVNEVTDSCLKDLAAAEQLLSADKKIRNRNDADQFLSYTRTHMNYWAIKGLQARIHLYRQDKTKAMEAAMEVINNQATYFPFVNPTEAAATFNRDRSYYSEQLFTSSAYKLKTFADGYFKGGVGSPATLYLTSAQLNTLFETTAGGSSDLRYNYQFAAAGTAYATTKYLQDDITENPTTEHLRFNIPLIRLSEMYYIAAECAATPDQGVVFLNTIRSKRALGALPLNISAANLETEIRKEYRKEFYAEGQLFFYYKRKNTARITKIDNAGLNTIPANYTLPLPDNEVEFGNH